MQVLDLDPRGIGSVLTPRTYDVLSIQTVQLRVRETDRQTDTHTTVHSLVCTHTQTHTHPVYSLVCVYTHTHTRVLSVHLQLVQNTVVLRPKLKGEGVQLCSCGCGMLLLAASSIPFTRLARLLEVRAFSRAPHPHCHSPHSSP